MNPYNPVTTITWGGPPGTSLILADKTAQIEQNLLLDLLKMHKTVKIHDEFAWREQFLVNCKCCDGQMRHVWRPGDEDYKCGFWQRAEKLGLTDGL